MIKKGAMLIRKKADYKKYLQSVEQAPFCHFEETPKIEQFACMSCSLLLSASVSLGSSKIHFPRQSLPVFLVFLSFLLLVYQVV